MSAVQKISALMLCFVLIAGCKKGDNAASLGDFHRYGIEHGHVHYQYSGDARGVEELVFDHWGRREVRIANQEHLQEHDIQQIKMINLSIGADIYSIDIQKHTALHEVNHDVDSIMHLDKESMPDYKSDLEAGLSKDQFVKTRTDTVLGLPVTVWRQEYSGLELYLWKAVLLKRTSISPTDEIRMIATSFDTVTPVDNNLFKLPPGIQMQQKQQ
jgi:hypothetical protein